MDGEEEGEVMEWLIFLFGILVLLISWFSLFSELKKAKKDLDIWEPYLDGEGNIKNFRKVKR